MLFLLESPIAVAAIGLVCVAVAGIFYAQTRSRASLAAVVALVLLTVAAVVGERLWLTPTERVRAEVAGLFRAIEANELPTVLSYIDRQAIEVRSDAETLMPRFAVDRAGEGGEIRVEFASPDAATAYLKPLIKARHKKSGATVAYFEDLRIEFVRRGERWLVRDYEAATEWRDSAALSR